MPEEFDSEQANILKHLNKYANLIRHQAQKYFPNDIVEREIFIGEMQLVIVQHARGNDLNYTYINTTMSREYVNIRRLIGTNQEINDFEIHQKSILDWKLLSDAIGLNGIESNNLYKWVRIFLLNHFDDEIILDTHLIGAFTETIREILSEHKNSIKEAFNRSVLRDIDFYNPRLFKIESMKSWQIPIIEKCNSVLYLVRRNRVLLEICLPERILARAHIQEALTTYTEDIKDSSRAAYEMYR